jgi:hypothetical protein
MYDPMYGDEQVMFATYTATWDSKYDNSNGYTNSTACPSLAPKYPYFHNIPHFPLLGAAFNIQGHKSPNCGHCWKLTNTKTHRTIYFTAIDTTKSGFVLSGGAFVMLTGGSTRPLEVEAKEVPPQLCGLT